jgi:hypothetical protein
MSAQLEAVKSMASECQSIVARQDELLFKVKALAATIWSAASGWAVTSKAPNLLIVAAFAMGGLWVVAATFRGAQKRYIKMSDCLFQFLTDAQQLAQFEKTKSLPEHVPRCLGGYEPRAERARLLWCGLTSPTVSVFRILPAAAPTNQSCRVRFLS